MNTPVSKREAFTAGLILISIGLFELLRIWIFHTRVEGIDPLVGLSFLGVILLALTPWQKVAGKRIFGDIMSIISFVIVGLYIAIEIYLISLRS